MQKRWIGAMALAFGLWGAGLVAAQDLSALARLDLGRSLVQDAGTGVQLRLGLSQAVPWRVRVLDAPPRLIVDFREVDWSGIDGLPNKVKRIKELRAGMFREGWSRLVLELTEPMVVDSAAMETDGPVAVDIHLRAATQTEFAEQAAQPEPADWALPVPAIIANPIKPGQGPLVVVLDPGHGGIDPGAERDDQTEAALMLSFARELKQVLVRQGVKVVLTRDEDIFVPLETRTSIAREAGASVLVSLHADALAEGEATGATIYTLAEGASDLASQTLAERHDRDDLLAGIDLTAQDDLVASVLMDMARTETEPRTARLVVALEAAIKGAELKMHRHPHQEAGFSVLKSPDVPSVLVEIGFLSSQADFKRLTDAVWRAKMAEALATGLVAWAAEDAAIRAQRAP